jgi:hypothetical protein
MMSASASPLPSPEAIVRRRPRGDGREAIRADVGSVICTASYQREVLAELSRRGFVWRVALP